MKQFSLKNAMTTLKVLSLASIAALSLTSCGGGSAADNNEATVRPKSLEGVVLFLDGNVRFEFLRSTTGSSAIENGQEESGTFLYNRPNPQIRTIDNQLGGTTQARFPDSLSGCTYRYRAINANSGVLTLTANASNDSVNPSDSVITWIGEEWPDTDLFRHPSTVASGNSQNTVVIDLTFSDTNGSATPETATVRVGSEAPASNRDVLRMPATALLAAGGPLPTNYNPTVDPNRDSRIAPQYLGNPSKLFTFTSNAGSTFNFTVQFTSDSTIPANSTYDESGSGLLRRQGAVVDNGINYTWQRIGGTDTGRLVITNAESTLNGTYTLSFVGSQVGSYLGQVDGDTTDINEVSGDFVSSNE